jgi:hypothetical protein
MPLTDLVWKAMDEQLRKEHHEYTERLDQVPTPHADGAASTP